MRRVLPVLALLLLALPALGAPRLPDGKWWKRPRIAAAIGLTAEQTAELEKIFARTKPRLIDLKAAVEKKEFAFQQAMEDPDVDRDTIGERIDQREEARASLQKELALMVLDMKRVLRDEQWERLTRIHRDFQQRVQERRRRLREEEEAGPSPQRPRTRRPRPGTPPSD